MNEKRLQVLKEETNNLKDIHRTIDVCYEKVKEKINTYNNGENSDINTYKKVDEADRKNAVKESKKLKEIRDNPYFGRMDLIYSGEKEIQEIYIGKQDLIIDNEAKIISWAAPIADVFNSGLGNFEKTLEDNKSKVSGKKVLKRKIIINHGELKDVISEGENNYKEKEEEYIKRKIKNSSTNKLNDILETIQEDQNNIIRQPINKSILIQGCAGSGKSSVAYHRIAQLIYNNKLKSDQVMVIGPNKLFMNYTKTITTDLGMNFNVRQITFLQFTEEILKDNFKYFKSSIVSNNLELDILKTSIKYKNFLDKFIEYLAEKAIIKPDISLSGYELTSSAELEDIWNNRLNGYKINTRIKKFKQYIESKLKDKKVKLLDLIEKEYELDEETLSQYCKSKTILEKQLIRLRQEKVIRKERFSSQFDLIVNEYLKSIKELDTLEMYLELLTNSNLIEKLGQDIFTIGELDLLMETKLQNEFSYKESIPIMYLHIQLNDLNTSYRHIVVDECQDLSVLELIIIEELTKSFTFAGDFNQRIVYDRDNITQDCIKDLFKNHTFFEIYTLNKSFRNSKSITNYSNEIIKSAKNLPIAFNRDTCKPMLVKFNNDNNKINYIKDYLNDRENDNKSIAIIFKDKNKCKEYHKLILQEFNDEEIGLIIDGNTGLDKRVNIITAPLSKGLEFKAVIVGDAEVYNGEQDGNLLYVQCTRALDELIILYNYTLPDVLNVIDSNLYEHKQYRNEEEINHLRICILSMLSMNIREPREEIEKVINSINDPKKLAAIVGDYYNIKKLDDLKKYL